MRNKSGSKIVCGILCLLLTALFALPAAAAGNQLTVHFQSGVLFSLYHVADLEGKKVSAFEDCSAAIPNVDAGNSAWQKAAEAFAEYVNENSAIQADRTGTTSGGCVTFSNLAEGYYLVTGRQTTSGTTTYQPTPVLVKEIGRAHV